MDKRCGCKLYLLTKMLMEKLNEELEILEPMCDNSNSLLLFKSLTFVIAMALYINQHELYILLGKEVLYTIDHTFMR